MLIFTPKTIIFLEFFSHLVNASTRDDHMFTARVIQHWGLGRTYLVPSYPKQFGHTTNTRFGGSKKPFFPSDVRSRNNHLHILIYRGRLRMVCRSNVYESTFCPRKKFTGFPCCKKKTGEGSIFSHPGK